MRWINAHPGNGARLTLVLLPFVLVLGAYMIGSAERLAENPNDKLLPSLASFAAAMHDMALVREQFPQTLLLDREGKIIARNLRGEQLGQKLKDIFGE